MSNVSEWSVVAGSNNNSPPDGWPEGMQRSAVNDTAREGMAAIAKWYQDSIGSLTTAGGTTAYTLTTNNAHAAFSDIPPMLIRINVANTGASTLNVDGLGAKSLTFADGSALSSGVLTTTRMYLVAYNTPSDRFDLIGTAAGEFASGTVMVFAQTAAPTGWTKGATHDNKALRLVTGTASSGGTTGFTSVFASRTIAQANLPNVNLSSASLTITNGTSVARASGGIVETDTSGNNNAQGLDHATATISTLSIGGSVPLGGSGTALDFAVQYVDVILATKT